MSLTITTNWPLENYNKLAISITLTVFHVRERCTVCTHIFTHPVYPVWWMQNSRSARVLYPWLVLLNRKLGLNTNRATATRPITNLRYRINYTANWPRYGVIACSNNSSRDNLRTVIDREYREGISRSIRVPASCLPSVFHTNANLLRDCYVPFLSFALCSTVCLFLVGSLFLAKSLNTDILFYTQGVSWLMPTTE